MGAVVSMKAVMPRERQRRTPGARLALAILLGPAAVLLVIGLVVPVLQTADGSIRNADGTAWVGLQNFGWVLTTVAARQALLNTLLWAIVVPLVATALGLALALLLDGKRRQALPRLLLLLPVSISSVGAAVAWGLVYEHRAAGQAQVGLLGEVMSWLGITDPRAWLLAQPWNTALLMVVMIWIQSGAATILLTVAIRAIPADVLEAAAIDGAVGWRRFADVIVPMIRGSLIVTATIIAAVSVKVFDIVRTMTDGNYGTQVVANEMFTQAFAASQAGRSSALAMILLVGVGAMIVFNVRHVRDQPGQK